jgi:hypothetical protein
VNRPYSYVCILCDADDRTDRYCVSEPVLGEFEQHVRDDLTRIIRDGPMYEDLDETVDRGAVFADKVADVTAEHAATIEAGTVQDATTTSCAASSMSAASTR